MAAFKGGLFLQGGTADSVADEKKEKGISRGEQLVACSW